LDCCCESCTIWEFFKELWVSIHCC
jgi:hypothetical protein